MSTPFPPQAIGLNSVSLPHSLLPFLSCSLLGNLNVVFRLHLCILYTRRDLLCAPDEAGCAEPYTGGFEGLGLVLPVFPLSKYLNAGSVATMTETDDSMWLHMLSSTGPSASVVGSGFEVAFVTCARRANAKAIMMVPRENITASPNFCWGETCSLRKRFRGRSMMRASAITSALVANLMDASARMRSSGSLHPAVRVRWEMKGIGVGY